MPELHDDQQSAEVITPPIVFERIGDVSRVQCACGARSEQASVHFVGDQCARCARLSASRRFGVGVTM